MLVKKKEKNRRDNRIDRDKQRGYERAPQDDYQIVRFMRSIKITILKLIKKNLVRSCKSCLEKEKIILSVVLNELNFFLIS